MLRFVTEAEETAASLRKSFLYASDFTIDNLTAIIMDASKGGFGLYEETARIKAHEVLIWLKTITGADIPDCKQENPDGE